jgi:hypothetical protein
MVVLLAGMAATIAFGALFAVIVLARERATQRRWLWGRHVIADAVVLTLLNVLPVPPLDGGRAVLVATSALSGQSLPADALFWIQACGFALAIIPVALWTRWTESIDLAASGWALPAAR